MENNEIEVTGFENYPSFTISLDEFHSGVLSEYEKEGEDIHEMVLELVDHYDEILDICRYLVRLGYDKEEIDQLLVISDERTES